MEIQVLKAWTETLKMLEEGLLLRGSFTPVDICSTSKLRLWLKSKLYVATENLENSRLAVNKSQDSFQKSLKSVLKL